MTNDVSDKAVEAARVAFQDRSLEDHRSTDERMRDALCAASPFLAGDGARNDKRAAIANIVIDAVKHVRQRPAGLRGPYVFNDEELDRLIALAAPPPQPEVEHRHTFVIPPGHEAVLDGDGRATGKTRPTAEAVSSSAQPEVAGLVEAARDVMAERERQKSVEGWTVEHDDKHKAGELARAAGIYALIAGSDPTTYRNALCGFSLNDFAEAAMSLWPWSGKWFKPTNRRRDLVKAGALILAEIERLDRAALASMDGGPK